MKQNLSRDLQSNKPVFETRRIVDSYFLCYCGGSSVSDRCLRISTWISFRRFCCALDKLCAVCIYLAITSAAGHMLSVTMILYMRFLELCEIAENTCNCNLVKYFYKLQLHKNKKSQVYYNFVKICN